MTNSSLLNDTSDANRDPLSGAPGAHPVGTGVGAALGGVAAGAVVGTVAGPVGTLIGAAAGAIVGGLAGKDLAESIDPTAEDAYWRESYITRPYVGADASYDDYGPAYGYGLIAHSQHGGRAFDDIEFDLARDWATARGTSSLDWDTARPAARDAWDRLSSNRP